MPLTLILAAIAFVTASGIPGLFFKNNSRWSQVTASVLMVLGALAGLTGAGMGLFSTDNSLHIFIWPAAKNSFIGLDPISAFFLVPVFLIGGSGSIFGLGYWKQKDHPENAQKLQLFWGILTGGMSLLIISRHAFSFLLGWEIMALSALFLISTEHENEECRKSTLIYLIATHIGTLALFGFFALWRQATGSFDLNPITEGTVSPLILNLLFFLSLLGFGLKAGMMPLHFWLPGAHASAPSHVSAMLSGVLLKVGIYGLIRTAMLLPVPPALWGGIILIFGAVSCLFGVVFALAQHDLKRLLAYHSIENIGIILIGLGIAYLGRSYNKPEWIALGMAGCLLHVWNHSLFKPLLFFGAGSIIHQTEERNIDSLGGLAKKMPFTALFFLIGAVAISGIPPLNGFISEFIIFIGLMRPAVDISPAPGVFLAAPILAMTGALAAACFVKVYAAVFLGLPRKSKPGIIKESSIAMLVPMALIASLCLVIGLIPGIIRPVLESVTGQAVLSELIPFQTLSWIAGCLLSGIFIMTLWILWRNRKRKNSVTWDCGYAEPTGRMQYTASSFGQGLTAMFGWILRPQGTKPQIKVINPGREVLESHVNEIVLDRILIPAFHKIQKFFSWFNQFQRGQTQSYYLYILAAVLILLATMIPYKDWVLPLFVH